MAQPQWKHIFGTDYSSIFVDRTGVYEPEMVLAQELDDDGRKFIVFRFALEKFKVVSVGGKKYLVPAKWDKTWPHPAHRYEPWFRKDLDDVARSVGRSAAAIATDLISNDPVVRRGAYEDIGGYYSFENFDSYPSIMSKAEMSRALRGK